MEASRSIIVGSSNSAVKRITGRNGKRVRKQNPSVTRTLPVDLVFENHFSLFLIRPVSPIGKTWLDENVGDENTLTFGGAVVCEPRYTEAIWRGAKAAGLDVR
jgi:hypothetical protein